MGVGKAEVAALTAVLQALLPRVVSLPLSIDRLNSAPWVPRKDYDSNVLVAGPLQAADGTELILDETALETGTLTQVGLTNLNSLKEVIQAQRVEYDFQFYQMGMARICAAPLPARVYSVPRIHSHALVKGERSQGGEITIDCCVTR